MAERMREPWFWKSAGGEPAETARMLYEPGNWGDVLKGTWAVCALEAVVAAKSAGTMGTTGGTMETIATITYVDPFAGAPTYPLSRASRRRIAHVSDTIFGALQLPHVERGRIASTAVLAAGAAERVGSGIELRVFDVEESRRAAWSEWRGGSATLLEGPAGDAVLRDACERGSGDADLVLIDPYDFFDRWGALLAPASALARSSLVLIYLYDKSPRSPGHCAQYRRLRQAVEAAAGTAGGAVFGRVPSDAVAPRAYHEMILLGAGEGSGALCERLQRETQELAARIESLKP